MKTMEVAQLTEKISKCLKEGNIEGITEVLLSVHTSEIAILLQSLDPEDRSKVFSSLDTITASQIILELGKEERQEILSGLEPDKIANIVNEMDSDDAADLIAELSQDKARLVLAKMAPEEVKEVETLLRYPKDTAGGIMQAELVQVTNDSTVRDTINWIRLIADEVEDFYEIYVTDTTDKLLGMVSLKKLVLANPMIQVGDIMEQVPVKVTPYVDQEEVANIFKKYDVVSMPVVNEEGRLLGRITADDVIDVITEEASEDIYRFAGVQEYVHPIYTPILTKIRLRIPWILLTLFGELLIAFVIVHTFKPTLERIAILAAFMPAIMATGGNVGLQTTTIVVRGLGMGTINIGQLFKLIFSEIKEGLFLGVICGVVAAIIGAIISMNEPEFIKLAFAIFVSMISAITATSFIGAAAPLVLFKLKFDPAAASGPFLTMFNDIFGSVVYLFIAMLIF
ncbi:MAG TPA: magnesium transporter [Thermodesulfobacteriota bacterium]|nr:magnesium transporter [Thermodesulfobacteriota bacterium]